MKKKLNETTILHEFNQAGQHRIVIVHTVEPPEHSGWFEAREMGVFKGFACSAQGNPAVPKGVFKTSRVVHQTVSA